MDKKVEVHYLFSKNKKIGSWIIRKGTAFLAPEIKETPSHVAILIQNKWVVESVLEDGFRVIPYSKFKTINTVQHKVRCVQEWTMTQIKDLFKPLKHQKYDYAGVIYFGIRIALKLLLGIPKPVKNRWHSKNRYFCSEVVGKMTGTSYEMTAPVELLREVSLAIESFKSSS